MAGFLPYRGKAKMADSGSATLRDQAKVKMAASEGEEVGLLFKERGIRALPHSAWSAQPGGCLRCGSPHHWANAPG